MNLIRQWSDDELNELLLRSDEHFLRPSLQALSQDVRSRTDHPEEFWDKQATIIQTRISSAEQSPVRRIPRLAWALATAVALAAVLVLQGGLETRVSSSQRLKSQTDADHELLVHVEEVIQSSGPEALEPAAMLAAEIGEHSPAVHQSETKKESTHED